MKLKSKIVFVVVLVIISLTTVRAEYLLQDETEIIGTWKVNYESPKLDGVKRELQTTWQFDKGGVMTSKSKDYRASKGALTSQLKYSVKDGKILKETRPGKYEECVVTEKEGNDMVVRCRNLYFFLTKQ